MDETEPQNLLDKRYKTTAAIYFAQIFSSIVLIFAAMLYANAETTTADTASLMPLWVAIVFIAIATFVLRRVFSRPDRLKDAKLLKGFAGLFGALQTNAIILGALAEAIAVVGLVIAFMSGNKFDALRAGAIALIVFLANFPRKSVWEKIAANLEKV